MAKRYKTDSSQTGVGHSGRSGTLGGSGTGPSSLNGKEGREQLAMKGKLHEIDLGAESRARNIAMTERATRRLRGNDSAVDDEVKDEDTQKARPGKKALGRNGNPQQRDRRNSDDIKRDQMVEQFLHENKSMCLYYPHRRSFSRFAAPANSLAQWTWMCTMSLERPRRQKDARPMTALLSSSAGSSWRLLPSGSGENADPWAPLRSQRCATKKRFCEAPSWVAAAMCGLLCATSCCKSRKRRGRTCRNTSRSCRSSGVVRTADDRTAYISTTG